MRTIATIFAFLIAVAPGLAQAQEVLVVNTTDDGISAGCTLQSAPVDEDLNEDCTLREAITVANDQGDNEVEIWFNLGDEANAPFEITPQTELPVLDATNTTIDGTTQAGYVEDPNAEDEDELEDAHVQKPVVIDGSDCTDGNCRGFVVTATGTTQGQHVVIRGLTINNFPSHAVHVEDGADRVRISRNFIGTDWQADTAQPNGQNAGEATVLVEGDIAIVTENLIAHGGGVGVQLNATSSDVTVQEGVIRNNASEGLLVTGGAADNFVFYNSIHDNSGVGIRVDASEQNRLSLNRVFANADPQIVVEDGANQNMPAPEIVRSGYDGNEIWVEYRVDADPDEVSYPLDIEFFLSTDGSVTAEEFLGEDRYSRDNALRNQRIRFFRPDFEGTTTDDFIVATATDAAGNSSQLTSTPDQIPVEFAGLPEATHNDGAVVLSWATLTEHNNAGFQIQQQVDGSFEDVEGAFVEGAGHSESLQNYEYTIEDVSPGTHTFRVEQVDFDGTSTYSEATTVTVPAQLEVAGPNPNPFADETQVTLSVDETQHVTVGVYDVLGRQVATLHDGQVAPEQPLDVVFDANGLSSGQYLIRVEGETFSEVLRGVLVR